MSKGQTVMDQELTLREPLIEFISLQIQHIRHDGKKKKLNCYTN